jgi:RNA polymerase sigma-70 factor (ECF subfamily)
MTQPLIDAAARGDRDAAGALVRAHYADVFRFCARMIGSEWAADAAQETFLTMTRRLSRFEGRSDFKTWLFGIARRQCLAIARKRRRDPAPIEAWVDVAASPGASCPFEAEAVRNALRSLSPEHREAVLLHEVEGLTYDEIAAVTGVPTGTVKSRVHYAFASMRRTLGATS